MALTTASPLVERDRELAALADTSASVARGAGGRWVSISGEAGIGKTALVRRHCEGLGPGFRLLWGACEPLFTPRPLAPFIEIAEGCGGELATLLERGGHPHEVALALLRELGGRRPTVLVLEDVHWADEATLDVLTLLSRRLQGVPALLLASYRDDEVDPQHPLRRVLGELATAPMHMRLNLPPLSPAAVATLARQRDIDPDDLYRKTAGNPFFVVEALAADAVEIPDTIRDAVLARVGQLPAAASALLEAVAIVSSEAELWLLETLDEEAVDELERCLSSGVVVGRATGVAFRHELARLAVEESISVRRRVHLHARALAALADPPSGAPDLARLAHHAAGAGDGDAVLRHAPAAAARAAALGAHREAAALYAQALRFGERLPPDERAELLELRSQECYLTDSIDEAIDAIEEAVEVRRAMGQRRAEGDGLRWLSYILWCPGRTAEAEQVGRQAVTLLEALPPGRELAKAYTNLAAIYRAADRVEEAIACGQRALELAESLGDEETAVFASATLGACEPRAEHGLARLERSLARALGAGLTEQVAYTYCRIGARAIAGHDQALAGRYLPDAIEFCSGHGLELYRLYLLAFRSQLELGQGRWDEAAETAALVVRLRRLSSIPPIIALVVLGLVRSRRGDPGQWEPLDEAAGLAEPTGELLRLGLVASARAEAAWLEGNHDAVVAATDQAFALALARKSSGTLGELAVWRARAGVVEELRVEVSRPYALELAGEAQRAAALWARQGFPYEAALALAHADDAESLRRALDQLQRLGAAPAAALVARRLRQRGERGLRRGPRPTTQANPAGLTQRQLDVLALLAHGLRNAEIAERLFLSNRTVEHHVAAILRKLSVKTRAQASAEAVRLGLSSEDR
jgi:DNA-binding NarL/FixJ family response regulator